MLGILRKLFEIFYLNICLINTSLQGNARRLLEKRCDGSTPLGKLSKLGLAPVLWFMILLLLLIYTNSVILGCYLCLLGSLLLQHIK